MCREEKFVEEVGFFCGGLDLVEDKSWKEYLVERMRLLEVFFFTEKEFKRYSEKYSMEGEVVNWVRGEKG